MLLTLSATPEPADGTGAPSFAVSGGMSLADFLMMVDMMGSLYDESEPKQDSDASGLLWIDQSGATITQAQYDAAPFEVRVTLTPKYRPRTRQEIWAKIAAGLTKGTIATAERRAQELALRALPPVPTLTAVAK